MSVSSAINIDPPILTSGSNVGLSQHTIPNTSNTPNNPTIYTNQYTLETGTYLFTAEIYYYTANNPTINGSVEVSVPNQATTYVVQKSWNNTAPATISSSTIYSDTLTLTCVLEITGQTIITITVSGTPDLPSQAGGLEINGVISVLTIN
jgi:hypothetical protein